MSKLQVMLLLAATLGVMAVSATVASGDIGLLDRAGEGPRDELFVEQVELSNCIDGRGPIPDSDERGVIKICSRDQGQSCHGHMRPVSSVAAEDIYAFVCPPFTDEDAGFCAALHEAAPGRCPDPNAPPDDQGSGDDTDAGGGNLTTTAGASVVPAARTAPEPQPAARQAPRRPAWQPAPVQRHQAFSAPSGGWTPQPASSRHQSFTAPSRWTVGR